MTDPTRRRGTPRSDHSGMRSLALLDRLFGLAHALACCAIAGLAGMIVVQVAARALDAILAAAGLPITGFIVPSLAEIAGFLFVAGTFLALASTLREGVHIRVTLLIDHVPATPSRILRTLAALLGAVLFGVAAWHAYELTADSVRFGEVSYGILAIPLALPQGAMTAGLVVFAIAMLAEAARAASGAERADDPAPTVAAGHEAVGNDALTSDEAVNATLTGER